MLCVHCPYSSYFLHEHKSTPYFKHSLKLLTSSIKQSPSGEIKLYRWSRNSPCFMELPRLITIYIFTTAFPQTESLATRIQSTHSHPVYLTAIITKSAHLLPVTSNGLIPSNVPTTALHTLLSACFKFLCSEHFALITDISHRPENCQLSYRPLHEAAVGMAWLLLESTQNGKAALCTFQKYLLRSEYTVSAAQEFPLVLN